MGLTVRLAVVVTIGAFVPPSIVQACATERVDTYVERTFTVVEPVPPVVAAPGVPVTYNYEELVGRGPEQLTSPPAGSDVVPGSLVIDRYLYEQYVWTDDWRWEVVGTERIEQGYWDLYWEVTDAWVDTSHDAWAQHWNWYNDGTVSICWVHNDTPVADWGYGCGHHGPGYEFHTNEWWFWHEDGYWDSQASLAWRWVDTSYDQDVWGWVNRGSWAWVERTSPGSVPPPTTGVRNVRFDARWDVAVVRQRMSADPRGAVRYRSLTFNYVEQASVCVSPT